MSDNIGSDAALVKDVPPWRNLIKIHPAAELFPLMADAELKELASNIWENGLRAPIVGWAVGDQFLLDGRNRLDALALLGLLYETCDHHVGLKNWNGKRWTDRPGGRLEGECEFKNFHDGDPYEIALSLNVHRRHLTAEQKRELIAKVLKAKPDVSNVTIAKQTKTSDKTVASVRSDLKSTSEIPRLEKTVGADGKSRKLPAKKAAKSNSTVAEAAQAQTDSVIAKLPVSWESDETAPDVPQVDLENLAEHIRKAKANLDATTEQLVTAVAEMSPEEVDPVITVVDLVERWEQASGEERAAFLDVIGVDAVLANMSPDFERELRRRVLAKTKRPAKSDKPKKFKTLELVKTTTASGESFSAQPRGKSVRH